MDAWLIEVKGKKYAAPSFEVLTEWVRTGKIRREYPVFNPTTGEWQPAERVAELRSFFAAPQLSEPIKEQESEQPSSVSPTERPGAAETRPAGRIIEPAVVTEEVARTNQSRRASEVLNPARPAPVPSPLSRLEQKYLFPATRFLAWIMIVLLVAAAALGVLFFNTLSADSEVTYDQVSRAMTSESPSVSTREAPIGLVDDGDLRIGVASCAWTPATVSILPSMATIGTRVGGWYLRDDVADDVAVHRVPSSSNAVTGGATIPVVSAAGTRAPDVGSGARLQLNLQSGKTGPAKGKLTFSFERAEQGVLHRYELDGNVSSLAVTTMVGAASATILGSATLRDLTMPDVPVVVVDGAPLLVEVTDSGEPSLNDRVSIILTNASGGVWLATGWSGTRPIEQRVEEGNLVIHDRK